MTGRSEPGGVRNAANTKDQVYDALRRRVLARDGWRCQQCGSTTQLEVHHQEFRSHGGANAELNLITLCSRCHQQCHGKADSPFR
jgi:5-methylcytosine-specific restriction endonuclease McrA